MCSSDLNKLGAIRKAALTFVKQLQPNDRVMIVTFDERVRFISDFTSNRAELEKAIHSVKSSYLTSLYDAIQLTINEKMSRVPGRKAIVILTDGVDTASKLGSFESSIDLVASKLTRQLNRFRERLHERSHGPVHRSARDEEAGAATLPPPGASLTDGLEAATPSRGVRRKYFAMPPMRVDEALQQLDVIDHDFFVFRDSESGQIQVAYRRNHGGFGVIQAKES